jgi:hypothetical protein
MTTRREPTVRIRCTPEAEARARAALERAGFAPERSLTWLVVRDASPDAVNDALVLGGADVRVVTRERIGQLVGWLLDRAGRLDGKAVNVQALVRRVLEDGGYAGRYQPRPVAELLGPAAATYEELLATGAAMLTWDAFVERFCVPAPAAAAPTASPGAAG